jgi:hypothetical protein
MAISHATRRALSAHPSLPLLPFSILSSHLISSSRSGHIPRVQQGRHKRRRRAAICHPSRQLCSSIIKTHAAFIHTYRREALDKEILVFLPPPLKQKECQALKLATINPTPPPGDRDSPSESARFSLPHSVKSLTIFASFTRTNALDASPSSKTRSYGFEPQNLQKSGASLMRSWQCHSTTSSPSISRRSFKRRSSDSRTSCAHVIGHCRVVVCH